MAIYQENQLSIFKRKLELDESFKSSKFKEIANNELNSNITNISISEKEMEESTKLPTVKSLETENPKENKQSWFSKFFKIKST
jgi:CRISPR/Cas system-associated protein endoribonuclease Cas2